MHVRAVRVSGELWQQICTRGWRGADENGTAECIEGLPEGARFVDAHYEEHWNGKDVIPTLVFIFEHPDFGNVFTGDKIPELDIVFERRAIK